MAERSRFSGFEPGDDGMARRQNADGSSEAFSIHAFMDALVSAVNSDGQMSVPVTRFEETTAREKLLYGLPEREVSAGAICVRAELEVINGRYIRPGRPPALDVEPHDGATYECVFASNRFSDNCFSDVTNGEESVVVGGRGCMKERQIDADLEDIRQIVEPNQ
jgi:hypothetical protein